MGLEADLQLSTDQALSSVSSIDDALSNVVQNFKVGLAEALDLLQQPVPVAADTSSITADIDAAVASADATVTPDASTAELTTQIDDAVAGADTKVDVTGEAGDVTTSIDDAIASADTTVTVEADTSQAEDALAGLGDAGSSAGKGLSEAASGATDASSGLGTIAPAAALASGEVGALKGVVGEFGPEAAGAAAATFGLVEAGKSLFDAALEQQTAIERLNRTFGDEAKAVEQIHLGGLNEDLSQLALQTGSNVDGLRNFAASFGQLGIDSGHAKEQVAGTVDQIIALASRASVLNPTLGSADEIVGRLSTSLARGGRFLSAFGISLTSAEINARALIDTGKQSATELTVYEKSAAGAEIATERLGSRLGKDITNGAQSDAIQVRRLGVELEEAKKQAGAALVEPVTESMKSLVPVATDLIRLLGEGLTGALRAVEPELKAVGTLASFLGGSGSSGFGVFGAAVKNLVGQINPLHQVGQLVSLTEGHFSDFAHGLPAVGVAFDVFDKGKTKTEQLAEETKKLAATQNDQAHATLIAAVNAGQLSRADEVIAIQQHTAKDGSVDWVGVLEQLQGAIVTTASKSDQYSEAVANQAKATKDAAQGQQDLAQVQLAGLVATGQVTQAQVDQLGVLNLTKEGTIDWVSALSSVSPAAAAVAKDTAIIAGGLSTVHTHMQLAADESKLYKESFDDLVTPTLNADQASAKFISTLQDETSWFGVAAADAKAYGSTISDIVDPSLAVNEANIKLQDTVEKTNKALVDNKGVVDERTKAGRDDEQGVIDLVKAYDTEIEAMIRSGESSAVVTNERQNEIAKLVDLKSHYPGLTQSVDEYIARLKEANTSGVEATRVQAAHRQALQDVIGAGEKWIETLIATGADEAQISGARQEEINRLEALKQQYPELGGVIDGYIAKLQAIPPSKDTLINLPNTVQNEVDLSNIHDAIDNLKAKGIPITVENVQQALNDAANVRSGVASIPNNVPINVHADNVGATEASLGTITQQLNYIYGLSGKPVTIPVNIQVQGNTTLIPGQGVGRMAGGPVEPFQTYVVNEQLPGPKELFVSTTPGRIVSAADALQAIREAAGSGTASFDVEALARVLDRHLLGQRPVVVNEVAQDPEATAFAVAARLGSASTR